MSSLPPQSVNGASRKTRSQSLPYFSLRNGFAAIAAVMFFKEIVST
ncbi:hypothetical protein ACKFKG_20820 [Phormidesmis sp. 146-35]